MVIASIILGILFIIGGISCMSAPIDAYLRAAHTLAILLFVYGIYGIFRFFRKKAIVAEFIVSILAVVIGFVYIFRPGGTPPVGNLIGLDRFVLFLVAAWFLIKGIIYFVLSIKTRYVNRRWIWGFFLGLLSILLGIYSMAQPALAAASTGTLIGFFFLECGIDLLIFGLVAGYITGTAKEIKETVTGAVDEVKAAAQIKAEEIRSQFDAAAAEFKGEASEAAEEAVDETAEVSEEAADAVAEAFENAVQDFMDTHEE